MSTLEEFLFREELTHVVGAADAQKALDMYAAFDPDLIVLDLMMPDRDGYAVLELLKRRGDPLYYRPVLVATADATSEAKRRALSLGAGDFLTKPFGAIEVMLRVWNLLGTRALHKPLKTLSPSEPPLSMPYVTRSERSK